ncbi:MAG: gluconokinase [Anaerolineales bacterium]
MKAAGLIVMGVSGCGKTSVGRELAARLGWDFFDADDYHPPENVAKMTSGVPLDDSDREPWLEELNGMLRRTLSAGRHPVLACSALKERYRDVLLRGNGGVRIVYLKGSFDLIFGRMQKRPGHYFKAGMLRSQFDALEEPEDAIPAGIDRPVAEIAAGILADLEND